MAHSYVIKDKNKILRALDVKKFGALPSSSTSFQDIWTGDVPYAGWDVPANIPYIYSTNAGDTGSTVFIQGLDEDGYMQEETVALNGTTNVNLANQYTTIYRAYVSNNVAPAGDLHIESSLGVPMSHVKYDDNQTLQLFWTVPKGMKAICKGFRFTLGQGKEATIRQRIRSVGGVWRTQDLIYAYQNAIDFPCKIYNIIPELTQVTFQAKTAIGGVPISGVAEFTLVETSEGSSKNPNK